MLVFQEVRYRGDEVSSVDKGCLSDFYLFVHGERKRDHFSHHQVTYELTRQISLLLLTCKCDIESLQPTVKKGLALV